MTRPLLVGRPGTPESVWLPVFSDAARWRPGSPAGAAVVVAPHPDDESLGAGGLISMLLACGWSLHVVAVTDGEAAFGPADVALAERRRREQEAALRCLAAGAKVSVSRLGLPDSNVTADYPALVDQLRPHLVRADLVLAPVPWDGHPDHDACGAATAEACPSSAALAQYLVWAWHWAAPHDVRSERMHRVDLPPWARRRKAMAMDQFRSQTNASAGPPILPPHVLARFERTFEIFIR